MNNTRNVFIMNNGFVDVHWGILWQHCVPMHKVIDKENISRNLLDPFPFEIYIKSFPYYNIKRVFNGLCGSCKGKHPHHKDKDAGIKAWEF